MKVKPGDVLVCQCEDCDVELTVSQTCSTASCGEQCDVQVACCDQPMALKPPEGGCGCCCG